MFPTFTNQFEVPKDWIYRGEGNCNLVISLLKERKILRIRKMAKPASLLSWIINWLTDILYWYCGNSFNEEQRDLTFYRKIIRPLIGSNFVCDAKQVFLSKKQIGILETKLNSQRPDFRKTKCLQYGRAALFDDFAFLPDEYYPFDLSADTFSIEIKPKQGWVPFSEKGFPKCIFCLKQFCKRSKGYIKNISSYCPLDLFSGQPSKMAKAIEALIENPQNNFKLFKNGEFRYGDTKKREDFQEIVADMFGEPNFSNEVNQEFCMLVQKTLLTNFASIQRTNYCDRKLFCEWNERIHEHSQQNKLPKGCVLERILSVQMLDVEGNQYYSKLVGNGASPLNDYDYVTKLLNEVAKNEQTCLKCLIMMLGGAEASSRNEFKLVPYLIAAIAKDCSIMMTFKRIFEPFSDNFGMKNVIETKFGVFVVNVGVFDLYPKPVSTIVKNQKKIRKLLELAGDANF